MLVGHFSAAMVGKSIARELPLWHFLLLANAADLLWLLLSLVQVEAFNLSALIPVGANKMFGLDLFKMPWSHSMVGALVLALVLGAVYYRSVRRNRALVFWVVAAVVFSHWCLDLIVHRPDLPLYGEQHKQGWGLWASAIDSVMIELSLLTLATICYVKRTRLLPPRLPAMNYKTHELIRVLMFVLFLVGLQLSVSFFSFTQSQVVFGMSFLFLMLFVPVLGHWVDNIRGAAYGATKSTTSGAVT
jgi:hypothetical protein